MPRGDGTGPNGMGPMTGRAMGYCAGFNSPGFMNPGFGRRFGRGFGRGRGRGIAFRARAMQFMPLQQVSTAEPLSLTKKEEKQYLKEELEALKEEIKAIEERLKELK